MNFLAHHYFYGKDNPHFSLGAIMPDLVKNFCNQRLVLNLETMPEHFDFYAGCQAHFKADAVFHNSNYFWDMNEYLKTIYIEPKWPRTYFFNHIFTEIILDRALMDENKGLCKNFYDLLKAVDLQKLKSFLISQKIENHAAFETKFQKFIKNQFIFDYLYNEKLIFALSMVYKKVGIDYSWTKADEIQILNAIPLAIEAAKKNMVILKKDLNVYEF